MRLALMVEYDGTDYHGFQYQVNARSIQEELEKAIHRFTGERVRVKGAGRTDAGVHAKGQVVAFDTCSEHPEEVFLRALNHYLPCDIVVRKVCSVPGSFDPRRMATSRRYSFTIDNGPVRSPLTRRTSHHVPTPLDIGRMRRAGAPLSRPPRLRPLRGPAGQGGRQYRQADRRAHSAAERPHGDAGRGG